MTPKDLITRLIEANDAQRAALEADADLQTEATFHTWCNAANRFDAALHVAFGALPTLRQTVSAEYHAYDEASIGYALMADNPTELKDASAALAAKIVWQQLQQPRSAEAVQV